MLDELEPHPAVPELEPLNAVSPRTGEEALEIWNEATFTGATRPIYAWDRYHFIPLVHGYVVLKRVFSYLKSKETTFFPPKASATKHIATGSNYIRDTSRGQKGQAPSRARQFRGLGMGNPPAEEPMAWK